MKIGFIGCGNMAAAMLNGILKAGILKPEELTASAVSSATRDKIRQELKIRLAASNQDVAAFSDIIFLAVKPQYYPSHRLYQAVLVVLQPGALGEDLGDAEDCDAEDDGIKADVRAEAH